MKTLKFLIASSAAMACAVSAFAAKTLTNEIYITGSTAFRAGAVAAIIDSLNSPIGAFPSGGSIAGSQAIIGGTLKSGPGAGDQVYYVLAWAGSLSGLQAAGLGEVPPSYTSSGTITTAFPANQNWLAPSNIIGLTGGNLTAAALTVSTASGIPVASGGLSLSSPAWDTDGSNPDAAFSDAFKGSTKFNYSALKGFDLSDGEVGIIPFVWVKGPPGAGVSAAAWNRFTNISQGAAFALITNGSLTLNQLTGNSSDSGITVVLNGRNLDSGTRFGTFAETQFGEINAPSQYPFTAGGTSSLYLDSVGTEFAAAGGNTSGGNITGTLKLPPDFNSQGGSNSFGPIIAVSYLGISDAKTVVTYGGGGLFNDANTATTVAGSTWIPGNTVAYSGVAAPLLIGSTFDIQLTQLGPQIETGSYSFWEYEHLYYNSTTVGGGIADVLNGIKLMANTIVSTDAPAAGLLLGSMVATRADEFSPVF